MTKSQADLESVYHSAIHWHCLEHVQIVHHKGCLGMRRGSRRRRRSASVWRKNDVQGYVLAKEKNQDQSHELGVNTQWLKSWQRFHSLVRTGCVQLELATAATSKTCALRAATKLRYP